MKFIYKDKNSEIVNLDKCKYIKKNDYKSGDNVNHYNIVFKGCSIDWTFESEEERDFIYNLIIREYAECIDTKRSKG